MRGGKEVKWRGREGGREGEKSKEEEVKERRRERGSGYQY